VVTRREKKKQEGEAQSRQCITSGFFSFNQDHNKPKKKKLVQGAKEEDEGKKRT